jgi:hypothetical protein
MWADILSGFKGKVTEVQNIIANSDFSIDAEGRMDIS